MITAALPYANGPLHIGHIAGAYLPADIYVRHLRSKGKDVVFIGGSDEHGAAITIRAKKEGVSPQEIVDKYHSMNKTAFEGFGISYDIYHRTSSELHHKTAADFFLKLYNNDAFTQETSEQYYDEENQQFLADRYITGTCPKCGHDAAYGDQCEKCGTSLSPQDLINPVSTLSGKPPVLKTTFHWYLPMQDHEKWLRTWIADGILNGQQQHNPNEWKNQVIGQCMSWIDGGLQPRAITRDLDWGVKVPLPEAKGKVLYVWMDAPIGYISATKQWSINTGNDWRPYWQNEETKLVHFIGKDNIVFHCIIFPIILKSHGNYILPDNVPSNEFLNLEGQKISTSRNWAVWLHEYLEDYPEKQDEMRYVLCSIAPESKDSEFTWKDYQARVNNELVAIYGNFVNRAVVLTHKYFNGIVPNRGELIAVDKEVLEKIKTLANQIDAHIEKYRFREAQALAMDVARLGNKYLADEEPWKLIKTNEERVKTVLNVALQIAANLSIVFDSFLPFTSATLREILNIKKAKWDRAGVSDLLKSGHQINKATLLFQKIEDEFVEAQAAKLVQQEGAVTNHKEVKPMIEFDDFSKLDIRTAEILEAQKHENADKLLVLKVDTGVDQRTIVSGIAEHYNPEDIIGKKVCVLLNLQPRKLRGVESQGMILMAESEDGKLAFIEPTGDMANGAEVR